MTLTIKSPPVDSPFDEKGGKITWSWKMWIQRLYTTYKTLIDTNGGANLSMPYAQFYDTTTQTAAAATVAQVTFNSTSYSNGVALGSPTSRMVVSIAGWYNVQFSFQTANTGASIDDFTCWFRKNGANIASTASVSGTPPKHGAIDGHCIVAVNFIFSLAVNDYLELCWTTDNGNTSILTFPASAVPPVHPLSPSVVCTFQYISR